MPDSDFLLLTLKGVCKQCGFEFRSIRHHLRFSPKCREKYGDDYNPEYILSGPCWSCGKVFKCIAMHLAKTPQCIAAYNVEDLIEARKLASVRRRKKYRMDNSEKIGKYMKTYYEDNREYFLEQISKYGSETKVRRKAVKKWKLDNQEKK